MNFGFTEEQEMIRKSARDFVRGCHSYERLRHMHGDERGFSPDVFRSMADAGWAGTTFPESVGGMSLGLVDLVCIMEELGRGLMPEPLLDSAILAGGAVLHVGTEAQREEILPKVVSGEWLLTLAAWELAGRDDAAHVATTAARDGDAWVLNGVKHFVPDAPIADRILVTARVFGGPTDREGIALFAVEPSAAGVTSTPVSTIDRRRRYTVELKGVRVPASAMIGDPGGALPGLELAIDGATVALCAEMLGGMDAALEESVKYSRERVQFGRPIGSFQAIKHKAANMFVAVETARSATYYAAMAMDEKMPDARAAVSCAKALCADAYLKVGKDAIQIHGGIGFTDECDIAFHYKRAIVTARMFGDGDFHRDRYAREKGF